MLGALARFDGANSEELQRELTAHLRGVASLPAGDKAIVARAEAEVRKEPGRTLVPDPSGATSLRVTDGTFRAGRFEVPTLGELRDRADRARGGSGSGRLRFHVVDGASPATDIGALQATAPPESLFQVASQFNCLEAPHATIVPVFEYFDDGTQGPRASISAFPGALLRHYAAPRRDGTRFVQRGDGEQINLLDAVCDAEVALVQNGYLMSANIARPERLARALEEHFDALRVGLHEGVEVVFGHDWDGPVPGAPNQIVSQVFTSTVAAGGYGALDPSDAAMNGVVRSLLRAAYEGTLLAAAALGKSHVVLTLIGGGVFRNPIPVIWESILWAVDRVAPRLHRDLSVVVNGYALGRMVQPVDLFDAARARGGTLARFSPHSVTVGDPRGA